MFSADPVSPRRRWLTLAAGTVVLQFAYWPVITSLGEGEPEQAGLVWLGLAVTPFVFLVLAFGSGHPRAPGAVGKAMGLFLLIALPVGLLDVVVGLVAGFGAAAAVALRAEEGRHSGRARAVAVVAASGYLLVLLLLAGAAQALGPFAIVSGAVLPLAAIGLADEITEWQASPDRHDAAH